MRNMLVVILLFIFCSTAASQSTVLYKCDFEEQCKDFLLDSYWIVKNISSHIDHTYQNISGHYTTYTNTSVSQPLTNFHTRDWVDTPPNLTICVTLWTYLGPGIISFDIELAQGDDHEARIPSGRFGMSMNDPQWRGSTVELPYTARFVPYIIFNNISGSLDIDDLSVSSCPSTVPIPPRSTVLHCDFDKTLCPDLISLSNYSYSWSIIQAEEAQNYTTTAPEVDYSTGDKTGHYIWLNNSDSLEAGGAGYLNTPAFRSTVSDPAFCLSFQYYRFGHMFETSRLTVLALTEGNEKSVAQVWPINPINYTYINERWSWAYAPLPAGNYSLLFRVDSDYEEYSSFALDSISVSSCGYMQYYIQSTSYLELACDFDSPVDSTCGIRDDYTDLDPQTVINYTIRSPNNIDDRNLGPRQTTGWSGNQFLYWSRSESTSATLINGQVKTPLIETNREMCIRFAYFVNSTDVLPLENNTKIQIVTRGCHIATLWSIVLDNSFGWQLVTMPLDHTACAEAIYFEITQQRPTRLAVAFDDITIAQCGTLDVLTTTVPPTTTTVPQTSTSVPQTTTMAPQTNTTVSPTNTTVLPTNTTVLPTNTTVTPTNTTVSPTITTHSNKSSSNYISAILLITVLLFVF